MNSNSIKMRVYMIKMVRMICWRAFLIGIIVMVEKMGNDMQQNDPRWETNPGLLHNGLRAKWCKHSAI